MASISQMTDKEQLHWAAQALLAEHERCSKIAPSNREPLEAWVAHLGRKRLRQIAALTAPTGGPQMSEAPKKFMEWQAMVARITALEAELYLMKTAGIIEVAVRNPSVSEYMAHWEGRAEKAEAENAALEAKLAKAVEGLVDAGSSLVSAISLLEAGREAVLSDKTSLQRLEAYNASVAVARAALAQITGDDE